MMAASWLRSERTKGNKALMRKIIFAIFYSHIVTRSERYYSVSRKSSLFDRASWSSACSCGRRIFI
jgi:hypothetical protein